MLSHSTLIPLRCSIASSNRKAAFDRLYHAAVRQSLSRGKCTSSSPLITNRFPCNNKCVRDEYWNMQRLVASIFPLGSSLLDDLSKRSFHVGRTKRENIRPRHLLDASRNNDHHSRFNNSKLLRPSQLKYDYNTSLRCYTNYPPNYRDGNDTNQVSSVDDKNTKDNIDATQQKSGDSHANDSATNALQSSSIIESDKSTSNQISDNEKPSEPSIHNISYLPPSLHPYAHLARLDKPIGTMLLLHPCLWSTTLAYTPLLTSTETAAASPLEFTLLCTKFALGSFIMRGAGCTINDMWDAQYDKKVTRTKSRPLASGALSYNQAWMFLAGQLSAGLAVLLSLEPHLYDCFVWGAASLPLVGMYPLMKRYTNYPQLVLGLTFNWGAIMGWVAVHGGSAIDWSVVGPLYGSGVCWTLIYDTLYAHQDKRDDAKLGLKSTALTFGERGTKPVLTALTGVVWGCWMLTGYNVGFGGVMDAPLYYGGVSAAATHLLWQVYTADLNNVDNLAHRFRSNNTVGWMVFASCVGGNVMMMI